MTTARLEAMEEISPRSDIALVDLLDRLLGSGVVVAGDIVITLAGVDLVQVSLRAKISSVRSETQEDRR